MWLEVPWWTDAEIEIMSELSETISNKLDELELLLEDIRVQIKSLRVDINNIVWDGTGAARAVFSLTDWSKRLDKVEGEIGEISMPQRCVVKIVSEVRTNLESYEEKVGEQNARYETALRILQDDAGIGERDLDMVDNAWSPVRSLRILRGERVKP